MKTLRKALFFIFALIAFGQVAWAQTSQTFRLNNDENLQATIAESITQVTVSAQSYEGEHFGASIQLTFTSGCYLKTSGTVLSGMVRFKYNYNGEEYEVYHTVGQFYQEWIYTNVVTVYAEGNPAYLNVNFDVYFPQHITTEADLAFYLHMNNPDKHLGLDADITLSNYLKIEPSHGNVELNLNGHTLSRNLSSVNSNGHVVEVFANGTLTLQNGTLSGGWANNGGGICNFGNLTLNNVNITNCKAIDGGGIHNKEGASLTITGGTIINCRSDAGGGAIVNYGSANISGCTMNSNIATTRGGAIWTDTNITIEGCTLSGNNALAVGGENQNEGNGGAMHIKSGTATLTNVQIFNNTSKDAGGIYVSDGATLNLGGISTIGSNTSSEHGGGGIVNQGTTVLSGVISITSNSCHTTGAGLWSNGNLSMQGNIQVKNNNGDDIYLKSGKIITITGALTSGQNSIGINMEIPGLFTNGYEANNAGNTLHFFASGNANQLELIGGEDKMYYAYYECTWDASNKSLVRTRKHIPEGQEFRNIRTHVDPTHGGYLDGDSYWFVVDGSIDLQGSESSVTCSGSTVHLILCDNSTFKTDGLYVNQGTTLHIYSQSFGDKKGKLNSTNSRGDKPGIGGEDGAMGALVVHGGNIYAKGGSEAAGIGGRDTYVNGPITIFDGYIDAHGGDYAAGIGTGDEPRSFTANEGHITIYGGDVHGSGGKEGAGIGGGNQGMGPKVFIHHGEVNATGGELAAGIGGGDDEATWGVEINGGVVYATGGEHGAGIGGGEEGGGGNGLIVINDGSVNATAGKNAAGIGGGYNIVTAGTIRIIGGRINASSGFFGNELTGGHNEGAAIGSGGEGNFNGTIEISGGTVRAESYNLAPHHNGAAIGAGDDGDMNGIITISGGEVIAFSNNGSPIGAGRDGKSTGTINLTGGRITLRNSSEVDADKTPAWVGHGANESENGTLNIGDGLQVNTDYNRFLANQRKTALQSRCPKTSEDTMGFIIIQPCGGHSFPYTILSNTQHEGVCDYCNHYEINDHIFNHGECTACHFNNFPNRFTTEGNWNDNANWSNGVPEAGSDVLLQAAATIPNGYLADAGRVFFDNCGSSLTIADGGQFKLTDQGRTATVQKDIDGNSSDQDGYYLLANPVTAPQNAPTLGMTANNYDLYAFDQSEELEWRNYKQNIFNLVNGKGYLYANSADTDITFSGVLNPTNADINVAVAYTADADLAGFNLVGNPFVCNAYLKQGSDYVPFYRMNDTGDALVGVAAGTPIKPMEGVFVKYTGNGTVSFITTAPDNPGDLPEGVMPLLPFHALEMHQDANMIEQAIMLVEGWNWWAPVVRITATQLVNALNENLEQIKSTQGNIALDSNTELVPGQMYKLQTQTTVSGTSVTGVRIVPTINIDENTTNWIGYTGETTNDIATGINRLFGTSFQPHVGDKIVSQDGGFLIYQNGEWTGTLTQLIQGQGYIYVRAQAQ